MESPALKYIQKVVCSQSGIVDPAHPAQGIGDIQTAGFAHTLLDLGMFCPPGELESLGEPEEERKNLGENVKDGDANHQILASRHPSHLSRLASPLLEKCGQAPLEISVMAAPRPARDTRLCSQKRRKPAELAGLLQSLTLESLRLCRQAGCRYLIVEPLFAGVGRGEEWQANREFYLSLAESALENKVTLLLKNQCRCQNGHMMRGICSDAGQAARWIDWLNQEAGEECFGFCMDVGICSLCGQDMREFIIPLEKRLKAVVLRDCDGHREASMLPFTCVGGGQSQTDWLGVVRGLRESCFDGLLLLDIAGTASAFSPILRPRLMQLAKDVGAYFAWQTGIESLLRKYSSIVLFGAGNMCRNYMKCYGEKYPPLFTCDNNAKLWGGDFCGLEVKNPACLKSLPEGCGIFICNIYYREIEEQIHSMGITENIEFFNDEYMPSFYFDRLEVRRND